MTPHSPPLPQQTPLLINVLGIPQSSDPLIESHNVDGKVQVVGRGKTIIIITRQQTGGGGGKRL